MPEWRPGELAAALEKVTVKGEANFRAGLLKIASAVEAKAKTELGRTTHAHGTPSPAPKGGPPSLVSGTGRRSVGHEISGLLDPVVKIGTIGGVTGPYSRTPSSKYLMYQETLARFNHPFLKPSFESVIKVDAVRLWLEAFHSWPRL